ncbi:MAG TPA: efflux RND transporter periplasmic adaptor subunit [Candidatus Sulfotelmatobacter sp.]|jgi:RND family efflux transporter MFP subunit|nr:efflux RND transporter periplasmic adaptor subunit [Candidatus Sulfotelmatobacter sp.]
MTTEGLENSRSSGTGRRRSPLFTVFFVAVAVLIVVGGLLLFQRRAQYQALAKETEAAAIPTVAVIHPSVEAGDENLVLPGTLQAYVESPIYARTNGYLRKWYHDIGSRVNKGELLVDIDTPEVDQQLGQSRADLNTAKANVQLSDITATRYTELLKTDGVTKQEVDNALGDQAAKRAIVESAEANVRRLEELESFKHIYAPFSGVLTQRNIDIGTLINAGNGGTSQQLFYLAQTDPIRVYVNVPEPFAPSIHPGIGAYLELTQYPGQKFRGKVVRTSNAIDLSTRTLLTEVDVPNASGLLLPGGYAQVHLEVTVKGDRLQVPINSLLFRAEGLRAVVVDSNHKARLQTLTIGRDYGVTLEVMNGLKAGDWIVLNPPDSLNEGQEVRVKEVPNPITAAPAAAPKETPKPPTAPAATGKKP